MTVVTISFGRVRRNSNFDDPIAKKKNTQLRLAKMLYLCLLDVNLQMEV